MLLSSISAVNGKLALFSRAYCNDWRLLVMNGLWLKTFKGCDSTILDDYLECEMLKELHKDDTFISETLFHRTRLNLFGTWRIFFFQFSFTSIIIPLVTLCYNMFCNSLYTDANQVALIDIVHILSIYQWKFWNNVREICVKYKECITILLFSTHKTSW